MFASTLGAITGRDNRLGLRRVSSALVIVVDGLGANNLSAAGGHARFLNRVLSKKSRTYCGFPSTTAASLTSFGTGLRPGEHGIVGYKVLDPSSGQPVNQLSGWSEEFDANSWQPHRTIAQLANDSGVASFVIGPGEYAQSGFTQATMRSAKYLPAASIGGRLEIALEVLSNPEPSLVYLYVPELDQSAHAFGIDSFEWRSALELLDGEIQSFATQLETTDFSKVGVLLTADHGVIDVSSDQHFFLDEMAIPELKYVAGEPRVNFLYLHDSSDAELVDATVARLNSQVAKLENGSGIHFASKREIINAGWYGATISDAAAARMPEIFALPLSRGAIYHREFTSARSQLMIGQHGGVDQDEISVPMLTFGAFAT
ncbi:MAG: hypothetical protein RLZ28_82 [Actinomycetota bacterium]